MVKYIVMTRMFTLCFFLIIISCTKKANNIESEDAAEKYKEKTIDAKSEKKYCN
jgi:hypothetical protein